MLILIGIVLYTLFKMNTNPTCASLAVESQFGNLNASENL